MAVELKKLTVDVAKETQEVVEFVQDAVKAVVEKKQLADLLPSVLKAVDGVPKVVEEAKSAPQAVATAVALGVVGVATYLLASRVVAVPGKA